MVYILILERCLYNGVKKQSTNGEGVGGREREMEKEEIKGRENEKMKHKNIILNKLACMQLQAQRSQINSILTYAALRGKGLVIKFNITFNNFKR